MSDEINNAASPGSDLLNSEEQKLIKKIIENMPDFDLPDSDSPEEIRIPNVGNILEE